MAESSHMASSGPQIAEELVETAKKAFDPSSDVESRQSHLEAYNQIIAKTGTWSLLSVLNSLVKPNLLPPWLRGPLLQTLTLLPMRSDGVRGTMEFVFSVHPSNQAGERDSQQPQKSGASITHEAVAVATRLLSTVPVTLKAEEWYDAIAPQLFQLLDGEAGPDLAKTAAQIVGFGILGKKATGAPGAVGWNAFVQPLLEKINPSLKIAQIGMFAGKCEQDNDIVDLSRDRIIVSSVQLEQALKRLKVLALSNPSPGLCKRVLKPVIIQLWALASIPNPPEAVSQKYGTPAQVLVQTYLKLFGNVESICPIIQNILCQGSCNESSDSWQYRIVDESNIVAIIPNQPPPDDSHRLTEIDTKADKLVQILTKACSKEEVSAIFLFLMRRWAREIEGQGSPEIKTKSRDEAMASPIQDLAEVTVLQKLLELSPEKLVGHFDQLLDIICQILKGDGITPLGDDLISVVLSLLNLVVTASTFQRSDIKPEDLRLIQDSLDRISSSGSSDVSATARNLAMLIRYRDEVEPGSKKPSFAPSIRQKEDKATYNLAMSYITDSENPPPVVSEGLNMLSTLILTESTILDVTAITALMSCLLKDNEDYVNLRVVKIFTQLANRHPNSTTRELLENYLDAQEKSTTDVRLRFGEALVQVIERLGETFSGDVARQASETLLTIAGRRGYRPKTMAKQARDEKLTLLKKSHASSKDNEDEDMDLDEEEQPTEEEKANNGIIAQILQGWNSKRGSEDVRMRTSALSIIGVALETNMAGIGPTLVSNVVDLCINILVMEKDVEYGILRRAAIMAVLSFVRALHQARESGRSLGFGLTDSTREDIHRTLHYVANTDNDGLVQQHARDVAEILENWRAGSLLPQATETSTSGLTRLAGLTVNPEASLDQASRQPRPRIEEVE